MVAANLIPGCVKHWCCHIIRMWYRCMFHTGLSGIMRWLAFFQSTLRSLLTQSLILWIMSWVPYTLVHVSSLVSIWFNFVKRLKICKFSKNSNTRIKILDIYYYPLYVHDNYYAYCDTDTFSILGFSYCWMAGNYKHQNSKSCATLDSYHLYIYIYILLHYVYLGKRVLWNHACNNLLKFKVCYIKV